jgi:hypothetical protein
MSTATILTTEVATKIHEFCDAFQRRWFHQPPEFTDTRGSQYFWDMYDKTNWCDEHPAHSDWYAELLTNATESDLDAMVLAFNNKGTSYATAFKIYLLNRFANEAYARFKNNRMVSSAIPAWLRKNGWDGLPDEWH